MQDPKWIPVSKTRLAEVDTSKVGTQSFGLPEIIPQGAREVLIYASLQVGNSNPHDVHDDIKIFTVDGSNEYAQYIAIHTYRQNAWVTNSSNMWFPVTNTREIAVAMPQIFERVHVHFYLSVIGYR